MWYLGSFGEDEKIRRTTGAASARPGKLRSALNSFAPSETRLTLGFAIHLIDTCTYDHNVVDDRETALAADPSAFSVLDSTVCQHCSFVHGHLLLVKLLRKREFILWEELPHGAVDNLIWSVAEYVNHRV